MMKTLSDPAVENVGAIVIAITIIEFMQTDSSNYQQILILPANLIIEVPLKLILNDLWTQL